MKKLLLLFLFSILLQSCSSYKSIDYNNIENEKKQNFEVSKLDREKIKGRLVSKNEKIIILETKVGLQTIPTEEIYDVKVKKFSFLKSVGLIIVTPYGLAFLLLALGGGM
jgi:uncharacterized protein YcfL